MHNVPLEYSLEFAGFVGSRRAIPGSMKLTVSPYPHHGQGLPTSAGRVVSKDAGLVTTVLLAQSLHQFRL